MYYFSLLKIYLCSLQREFQYKIFSYLNKEFNYLSKRIVLFFSKISSYFSIFSILGTIFLVFLLPLSIQYMTFILYYTYFLFSIFKYKKEKILNKYFLRWAYEIHLLHLLIPLFILSLILSVHSFGLSIFLIVISPIIIRNGIKRVLTIAFYYSSLFLYLFFPVFKIEKIIVILSIYLSIKFIDYFVYVKHSTLKITLYKLILKDSYQYLNRNKILISNFIILFLRFILDMLKINTSDIFFVLCTASITLFVILKKSSQLNNRFSLFITGYDLLNSNISSRIFYKVLSDFVLYIPVISSIFIFLIFNFNTETFILFVLLIVTLVLFNLHSNTIFNSLKKIRSVVENKSLEDYTSITIADSLLFFILIVLFQLFVYKMNNLNMFSHFKYFWAFSEFIVVLLYWVVSFMSISINILNFKQTRKR